jgi:hypothetical protein
LSTDPPKLKAGAQAPAFLVLILVVTKLLQFGQFAIAFPFLRGTRVEKEKDGGKIDIPEWRILRDLVGCIRGEPQRAIGRGGRRFVCQDGRQVCKAG